MKKILICAALFLAPLSACEWTTIWDEVLDFETKCLFYDAWNDKVIYAVPDEYMFDMFQSGASVVITHWIEVKKPNSIFADKKYTGYVEVDIDVTIE